MWNFFQTEIDNTTSLIEIPGIFCFLNSGIFLLNLIAYFLIFKIFIKEEERYLLKEFGKDNEHYRKNVNTIFPKLSKYNP